MTNALTPTEAEKLTPMQVLYIEALFGEANGIPHRAAKIAGYANPGSAALAVNKAMNDLIIDKAKNVLALHGPQAAMTLVDALVDENITPKTTLRLRAAEQVLDRLGVSKTQIVEIDHTIKHAIFILPSEDPVIIDGEVVQEKAQG